MESWFLNVFQFAYQASGAEGLITSHLSPCNKISQSKRDTGFD